MAESSHHRRLVSMAARTVRKALSEQGHYLCFVDGFPSFEGLPPTIDGHRPDVYATSENLIVVGEAKPPWDLETRRSEFQLCTFLNYVEREPRRHFVMAVHWASYATARSILKSIATDWTSVRGRVHILDGLHNLTLPSKGSNVSFN